jgi:hypothetical protein
MIDERMSKQLNRVNQKDAGTKESFGIVRMNI